jgi:hypothetical protein
MSIKSITKIFLNVAHFTVILFTIANIQFSYGQENTIWHNTERFIRYHPDGEDFVIVNGSKRFNRAIYGTNTGFRIEAGDLPEFALYLPGMGGNLKFGVKTAGQSKWLIEADTITTRYRPGSMLYCIKDKVFDNSELNIAVLALDDAEGMIVKISCKQNVSLPDLMFFYGGASGTRFHRDGDLGADPESSFYLKPEYCRDNKYTIRGNQFSVMFNQKNNIRTLSAVFPPNVEVHLVDAQKQKSPLEFFESHKSDFPVAAGKLSVKGDQDYYIAIYNPETCPEFSYPDIPSMYERAEQARRQLTGRIRVITPDPYINTLGGALSIAANAIWEYPSYLHGAVAWRSRLNGWRGIYAADPLGWHDRAVIHFRAYAKSQYTSPADGPNVPDPEKNWARQKEEVGTALFTSGYISRRPGEIAKPHHYDMNLVFIDALLRHINWTGDLDFVREMWPLLKRHLAWEKRCFDGNDDGLYDAYCCIWASDALQYSGGGVTHASAYNYKANKIAAELAERIGENSEPFKKEAAKILKAIQTELWMPEKGWFAEYEDLLGLKQIHPCAGLWTVYHAIDSDITDAFQAYQTMCYVDNNIPHIPIKANSLPDNDYYTLSTTNWQPYTWSVNNVALAEVLHTTLAYWQAGRAERAFKLWKGALLESMYLGSSPGNFQQLSFYDAIRGELYRDFADPIGIAARTLVEGLFGINPDALNRTLSIRPNLPREWNSASLHIPDVSFDFIRKQNKDTYFIIPTFSKPTELKFQISANRDSIASVKVNGKKAIWTNVESAIEEPMIEIDCSADSQYNIEIEWQGFEPEIPDLAVLYAREEELQLSFKHAKILELYDPQRVLSNVDISRNKLNAKIDVKPGNHTLFVKLKQGQLCWWEPLCFEVKDQIEIVAPIEQKRNNLKFRVHNYTSVIKNGKLTANPEKNVFETFLSILPKSSSQNINIPIDYLVTGSNLICFEYDEGKVIEKSVINWDIQNIDDQTWQEIDLSQFFNDKVTNIFQNQYLSPRSPYPTLQLPLQGIGNWCYPLVKANIDDTGLRRCAVNKNKIVLPQGIPFATPGDVDQNNIIFTSLWDNYPDEIIIPLSGYATHAYFLMAGSTNPMQSQFINGLIIVEYMDNHEDCLPLRNPESWWPIEQDYYDDGFAFSLNEPKPVRVHLKTGYITCDFDDYVSIKGFTSRAIDGGAATVLDLPLNPFKELEQLKLKTTANDVIIGLMSMTLIRDK